MIYRRTRLGRSGCPSKDDLGLYRACSRRDTKGDKRRSKKREDPDQHQGNPFNEKGWPINLRRLFESFDERFGFNMMIR